MSNKFTLVQLDSDSKDYTCHQKITFGKAGNHKVYYTCQLFNYKKNAICGITKRSKKEMKQHQQAMMHSADVLKIKTATTLKTDKERLPHTQKQTKARIAPVHKPERSKTSKAQLMKEEKAKDTDPMEPLISSLSQLLIDDHEPPVFNTQREDDLASSIESVMPVEHLQLWQAKQKVNMLSYIPQYCNKHQQDEKCKISLNGHNLRHRCYDVSTPFLLQYHRYYCQIHDCRFSLLQLELQDYEVTPQIVVFDRTVVTTHFLEYIFNTIPDHCFNFSALSRAIFTGWVANLTHKLRMALFTHVFVEDDIPKVLQSVEDSYVISSSTLEALYLYKFRMQQQFFNNYTSHLVKSTGAVLRIDHTYKIASALSAVSDGKRVQVKASLLSILNEHGQVLRTKLVPSDERSYMFSELKAIFDLLPAPVTTHIFTDDSRKDKSVIEKAFWNSFPNANNPPKTCQDVWHVIHRIDTVLAHNHPDYYSCKKDLSAIFAQLANKQSPTAEFLHNELHLWLDTYRAANRDNDKDMQLFIENLAETITGGSPKPASFPSIFTTKVEGAVNNFLSDKAGYSKAVLNSASLKEFKRGTNANEAWHKYLKKSSPFYSGSCSFELLNAIITHLQFLFNYSKENKLNDNPLATKLHEMVQLSLKLTTPYSLNAGETFAQLLSFSTMEDLKFLHFTTRKANYPKVSQEDIQKCIAGLNRVKAEKQGISFNLLYFLAHDVFEEKYTKGYIRKIVYEVAKQYRAKEGTH